MPAADLVAWAAPRLSQLLPLDEESLTQIITYSATLPKDACAEHLKNLLGDSPAALEFISSFNSRRGGGETSTQSGSASPGAGGRDGTGRQTNEDRNVQRKNKRTKAPLHSAGPARRPENYGNVTGGYMKSDRDEVYMPGSSSRNKRDMGAPGAGASLSDALALSDKPAALQVPQTASSNASSLISSRNPSPAPKSSTKTPPSAAGPLISDYLPNVKSKTAKSSRHASSGTSTPGKQSITTGNIEDLTAAIAALEVSTNPTLSKEQRKCNCNASLHPLFTPAPNCLNCGKIICSLEGLQPCSFCGAALLSSEEIQSMIKELRAERGNEKMRAHNDSLHHDGGPGRGLSPSKLDAAKAHRDKLLAFQAQNAQRTKVVDEAADFETPNVASTQWMSPAQRALALKKQQRILREMEEKARPEWEKKKTVMSLDIKGGRVVRTYQASPAESSKEEPDAEEEELARVAAQETGDQATTSASGTAFGKNPLLAAGGLVRPVWKAPTGKAPVANARKEKTQTWRRVQDDNDDNEQWILDGGLHGYGTEGEAT
ncbi:hypothetical protein Plec18167_006572 [Paecilomyces lecythidis]|uniref:TRIP4/RQT4 C2HC5-type zinc finger domain-containing protein n=1 Tax=Paecilomyces lecythidis TaxID=3004212 RepID=A0ABR3XB10_9EURO